MEGTIENNAFLERYYCPLKFNLYDRDSGEDEDECWYEIDGKYGSEYEGAINDLLEKEHSYDGCSPEDMAKYQDNPKVLSAAWGVENVNGTLYGCIDVKLSSPLTPDEEEALKRWISGQNSDGFGEGLEQRPFYEGDIEGYVSFWNSGNDYFIKNKAEFDSFVSSQKMGGLQL